MHTTLRLRKLWTIARNPRARTAFRIGRVAPSIELDPLLADVQPRAVVDVGANIGQFSLLAAIRMQPEIILAFEPLSAAASTYRSVFMDDPSVHLYQCALGAKDKLASMHVTRAADSSSLLPISALQTETFPGTDEVAKESVEVRRLATILDEAHIPTPALLKIDVQGYELEVLKGAATSLSPFEWILAELSFSELYEGQPLAHDVIAWLQNKGYGVTGVTNSSSVQADFLFRRQVAA